MPAVETTDTLLWGHNRWRNEWMKVCVSFSDGMLRGVKNRAKTGNVTVDGHTARTTKDGTQQVSAP